MKKIILLTIIFLLTGCTTFPHLSTESGKPEVTINVSKEAIFNELKNRMIEKSYELKSESESNMIFSKEMENIDIRLRYFQKSSLIPEEKISFDFTHVENGVKIIATYFYVIDPGISSESEFDYSGSAFELQDFLNELKNDFEKTMKN